MHRLPSTIIFPKMLHQFENLAEMFIILLFTHFYAKNKNHWSSPTLDILLQIEFISFTKNVYLANILHPEGDAMQNDFEN